MTRRSSPRLAPFAVALAALGFPLAACGGDILTDLPDVALAHPADLAGVGPPTDDAALAGDDLAAASDDAGATADDLLATSAADLLTTSAADLAGSPPAVDLASPPPPPDLASPPPPPDLASPPPPPDLASPPDPCGGKPDLPRLYKYIEAAVRTAGYCPWTDWAVSDFSSGARIEVPGATNPHESASTIKLFVLVAVLDDIEHGKYGLSSPIFCTGANLTVDQCLGKMISVSDNCATYSLVKRTTLAHVNAMMHGPLGMATSAFHHWCFTACADYSQPCPSSNTDGVNSNNTINAHDVAIALERLHGGHVLPTLTQKAYDYLVTAGGWTKMITRQVPVPFGHKQGWLPAAQGFQPLVENDAGIAFACRPFGLDVLIERPWTKSDEDSRALDLGAQIGRLAYCTFHPAGKASDGTSCAATFAAPPGPPCQ